MRPATSEAWDEGFTKKKSQWVQVAKRVGAMRRKEEEEYGVQFGLQIGNEA